MKRAKLLKYILISSAVIITIIISALILFVHYFPEEKLLGIITERLEKTLNKKVEIRSIQYGIEGIVLNDVKLYNGLSAEDELIMSARNASIRLSLLPLLNQELIISRINLINLKINLTFENERLKIADLFKADESGNESAVSATISYISFTDASVTLKDAPRYLVPLEGEYRLNGDIILDKENNFNIKKFKAVLPEDRGVMSSDLIEVSIADDNFKLIGDVNCDKCRLPWVYKFSSNRKFSLPFENFSGEIRNLTITKSAVEGLADGKSLLSNSAYVEAEGACRVDIADIIMINLINVKGRINKSSVFANEVSFSTGGYLKKLTISDIDVDLNQIKVFFPSLPQKLYGRVSGNIDARNKKISGNVTIRNGGFDRDEGIISDINTELNIKDNSFYKENIKALIYNQPCFISISTSDGSMDKIALNLSMKEFKFNMIRNKDSESDFGPVKIKNWIYGRINIDKLYIKKAEVTDFTMDYSLQDGALVLNRIFGNSMGGIIKSRCTVDISEKKPPVIFALSFNNIKIQNIAALLNESAGRFFGIARGEANIKFNAGSKEDIYNSLKGNVEFFIDKGKFLNTGIQKGLSVWLSELEFKLKDLEFNTVYGNFNISGNNYNIKSLMCNATDIKLSMDGFFTKRLDEGKVPGDTIIKLEFNQNFIKDIANIPQQFAQTSPYITKKGNWYIMSFQNKGDDITDSKNIKRLQQ